MKKTYMQPLTKVVKVNAEQMICASTNLYNATYNSSTMTIADKEDDFEDFDESLW